MTFQWVQPSLKQRKILEWWMDGSPFSTLPYILLEGSVRSAKTSTGSFSFVLWAMTNFNGEEFAFCGKTIGACRRNLVRPLKQMLAVEPGFEVKDKLSVVEGPHLVISYCGHTNVFWVFGGKDEASQDLVQGVTLAGIMFDEVLLMPLSFVWQGLNRLSRAGSKAWFTDNPESPNHQIYREILDPYQADGKLYFLRLTLDDNPALPEDAKARLKSQYPVGSVLYRRTILGLRTAAEGRVFSFFDEAPGAGYVVDTVPENFTMYLCGLDYGISNPFAAQLWGLSGGIWYVLKEYYWDSQVEKKQKSNAEYIEDLARLCYWNGERRTPVKILIPPEENGFQREVKQSKHPQLYHVRDADNAIMPGIEDLTTLLTLGKLKILRSCEKTIWGINELLWDEKKQKQGVDMFLKGGSGSPDHSADASRYIAREAAKQLRQMRLL